MNDLENYTIDVLRAYTGDFKGKWVSVETIINHYFRYTIPKTFAPAIQKNIVSKELAFPIEEEAGLIINDDEVDNYLAMITTDEYILDRCFDQMQKNSSSPHLIIDLIENQKLKVKDNDVHAFEAEMMQSGLVDYSKSGGAYYYSLNLNSKGIIVLRKFDKYSDYRKSLVEEQYQKINPSGMSWQRSEIENLKQAVFKALKGGGIGNEVVWENIAKTAGVPDELSDDLKNILYHQGYIVRTKQIKGYGDLIKATPSVTAAIYDLESKLPSVQVHHNITAGRDINQSGNVQLEAIASSQKIESKSSNKKYGREIVIGVIVTVVGGLLLWGIVELVKAVSK